LVFTDGTAASAKRVIELETGIMTGNIIVKAARGAVLLARTLTGGMGVSVLYVRRLYTSGCPSVRVVCRSIGLSAPARVVERLKLITTAHMSSVCDQPKNTANIYKHLETTV